MHTNTLPDVTRDLPSRVIVPAEFLTRLSLQPATALVYACIIASHQHNKACVTTATRLGLHLNMSIPAVSRHLAKLEQRQLIERIDNYTSYKEMLIVPILPPFLTLKKGKVK